jgi:hypothetical protein
MPLLKNQLLFFFSTMNLMIQKLGACQFAVSCNFPMARNKTSICDFIMSVGFSCSKLPGFLDAVPPTKGRVCGWLSSPGEITEGHPFDALVS